MIAEGLTLTIVGMAIVFVFLILLVLVINLLSMVVLKYFPEKAPELPKAARRNDSEIAVALAAVKAYTRS